MQQIYCIHCSIFKKLKPLTNKKTDNIPLWLTFNSNEKQNYILTIFKRVVTTKEHLT